MSISLKLNNKFLNLEGFSLSDLENIFSFCQGFFKEQGTKIDVVPSSHVSQAIQMEPVLEAPPKQEEAAKQVDIPVEKKNNPDVVSPHECIPKIMDFDKLKSYFVSSFPDNKVDTNIQNARVIKSLFTTHLQTSQFNFETLKNSRLILKSIKDRIPTAQKSILSAVSKCFHMYLLTTPDEYIQHMKNMTDEIESEMKKRIFNQKEEDNFVSNIEIQNVVQKYKDSTDLQGMQKYLMILLYTEMEPLRLDYIDMIVSWSSNVSDTENYINLNTGHIFLRKYKTSKVYGEKIIKLPNHIHDYVKKIVEFRKSTGICSDYLFINPSNYSPMIKSTFVKYFNSIFGKSISVNILRKRWVSTHIDAAEVEKQEQMAEKMCHSSSVQKGVYLKHLPKTE